MDGRVGVEGSLTAIHCASYETGKELIKRGLYFVYHLQVATITDRGMLVRSPSQVAAPIDILTEGALLEVFDFYLCRGGYNDWHALVHVCRRWRYIFSVHQVAWFCYFFARPQYL
jgi:hypothetical protein